MNDILPPRRPQRTPGNLPPVPPASEPREQSMPKRPEAPAPAPQNEPPVKKPRLAKKNALIITAAVIGLLALGGVVVFMWYKAALQPVAPNDISKTRVEVVKGSSPSQIADMLKERGLIKSTFAFDIYTRLSGTRSVLQAGAYRLSPSETTPQIVDHMVAGRTAEFSLTFYPGATLTDETDTPENKKTDVETVLLRAGFSEAEIDTAFAKDYDHPLFATKPAGTTLEGYVYGETYNFHSNATVEDVLTRTFDEYYEVIQENNLIERFEKQGLTLYEGITLASIIQKEEPNPDTQKQIAQVFYKRLSIDMELGSDPTYRYAAEKMGVPATPSLDSPYNTRRYKGLPPGPISVPGRGALLAVADPAKGEYLYFLSGDDDVTYFAYTFEEHEQNIRDHCKIKCSSY